MNLFKRLTLLVFGLCGMLSFAALVLPWFGPWTQQATALLSERRYYLTLEVLLGVTAAGLLIVFLVALLAPRRRKVVEVMEVEGDTITVACSAISSQARHVVEQAGGYAVERVRVRARARSVRVFVRVRPHVGVDVTKEGPALRETLVRGIALLVGGALRGVDLEFVDAAMPSDELSRDDGSGDDGRADAGTVRPALVMSQAARGDITVSLEHVAPSKVLLRPDDVSLDAEEV